jgi:general L-amino acid transport system substrate-binding protein
LLSQPDDHIILVSDISREPLGPVVRHGDDNWLDVVTWTIQCMLTGEFHGISQENIAALRTSDETTLFDHIGASRQLGRKIGLSDNFCYEVILQVGNYKDVYDRHLGPDTEFNLPRGLNALFHNGGLHYPLPMN